MTVKCELHHIPKKKIQGDLETWDISLKVLTVPEAVIFLWLVAEK